MTQAQQQTEAQLQEPSQAEPRDRLDEQMQLQNPQKPSPRGRRCFVTVGATASFRRLLDEVIDTAFLDCLWANGFVELVLQTGPDHDWALQRIEHLHQQVGAAERPWPAIRAISYTTDMASMMLPCRGGGKQGWLPGAVISHAGSGSILDATRLDAPLIVVANPGLAGNHQEELARAVHEAGWAIKGDLGHLHRAIAKLIKRASESPLDSVPPCEEPPFPVAEDERCGLFDWTAVHASQSSAADSSLLQLD